MNPDELWFNTPDSNTLCRAGGNGPDHPSQLYALKKYWSPAWGSILDYGAGSGTTYEAIRKHWETIIPNYRGLDIIPKNAEWCNEHFKVNFFKVNPSIHKIDEPDQSWDLVYSRHVVDHMESFEKALDEHCRVARKLVIITLWVPLSDSSEHQIKNIIDQGKTYQDEYTNSYSREKVLKYLVNKEGWKLLEITENIKNEDGSSAKHDTAIVLQRI